MERVGKVMKEVRKGQTDGSEMLELNDGGCHHAIDHSGLLSISFDLKNISKVRLSRENAARKR
jgi:hypothetical protein